MATLKPVNSISDPNKLEELKVPQKTPSMTDFLGEAKKLGLESFNAYKTVLDRSFRDESNALQRKLVGQNVAPESQIGALNVEKFLTNRSRELEPVAQQVATQTALQSLNRQYDIAAEQRSNIREDQKTADLRAYEATIDQRERLQELENIESQRGYLDDTAKEERKNLLADIKDQRTYQKGLATNKRAEEVADRATDQAYQQKLIEDDFRRNYGVDDQGIVFTDKFAAETYWEQKGYNKELTRDAGINPETNKPFTDLEELSSLAKKDGLTAQGYIDKVQEDKAAKEEQSAITSFYGETDLAGNKITTRAQGEINNRKQIIIDSVGKTKEGTLFNNIAEGEKYWKEQDYNTDLIREAGMNPVTKVPFSSIEKLRDHAGTLNLTAEEYIAQHKKDVEFKKDLADHANLIPTEKLDQFKTTDDLQFWDEHQETWQESVTNAAAAKSDKDAWTALEAPINNIITELQWVLNHRGMNNTQKAELADLVALKAEIASGGIPTFSGIFNEESLKAIETKSLNTDLQSIYDQSKLGTVQDVQTDQEEIDEYKRRTGQT